MSYSKSQRDKCLRTMLFRQHPLNIVSIFCLYSSLLSWYCSTINVFIALYSFWSQVFARHMAYTAVSRVISKSGLKIWSSLGDRFVNLVYYKLLGIQPLHRVSQIASDQIAAPALDHPQSSLQHTNALMEPEQLAVGVYAWSTTRRVEASVHTDVSGPPIEMMEQIACDSFIAPTTAEDTARHFSA